MKNPRLDLLAKPLFIFTLGLLLLNDFYLKYEFSNFFTGKLSDFAGLFIFPYFFSVFGLKWRKFIYYATALLFIFWKSSFSQEFINWLHQTGIRFDRIVDYTDLAALSILPLSYKYFHKQLSKDQKISKYLSIPLGICSLFAIGATTLPHEKVEINLKINEEFKLDIRKSELLYLLEEFPGYRSTMYQNLKDSLFILGFRIKEFKNIGIRTTCSIVSIDSIDSNSSKISLEEIDNADFSGKFLTGVDQELIEKFKSMSREEFIELFQNNVIDPIKNGDTDEIYYYNKLQNELYPIK